MSDHPQVADSWGRGTHDAAPGELERLAASALHDARSNLIRAVEMLEAAQLVAPGPDYVTQISDLEEASDFVAKVRDALEGP